MYQSEIFYWYRFFEILIVSLILILFTTYRLEKGLNRMFYLFFSAGFFFYSGVGYSYKTGVADGYLGYYTIFLAVFSLFSILFSKLNYGFGISQEYAEHRLTGFIMNRGYRRVLVVVFLFTYIVDLTYPEFNIVRIVNPPSPDITGDLVKRFDEKQTINIINTLTRYTRILLFPFYILSIFGSSFKKQIIFLFWLLLPLYLEYCANSYLGRSAVLINLLIFYFTLYKFHPSLRRRLTLFAIGILPLFLVASLFYQLARVDRLDLAQNITPFVAFEALAQVEFGFPTLSAKVVEARRKLDLVDYFIWQATISIPKFGLFKVDAAHPAYDISEIVTGVSRYSNNFNVKLSGYLTESIYIYGKWFFWLNAVFLATAMAVMTRIFKPMKLAYPIVIFLCISIGYNLNRAGIQSALPLLTTYLLPFYVYAFLVANRVRIKLF